MIKIWGRTDSSNVQKVLWCLGELGLEFERLDWGGKFGGNKNPEYLAINPNGLVPTIKDGDFILWESNSIMRYLNAKYGNGKLLPVSPEGMASANRWMDWQLSVFNGNIVPLFFATVRTPPEKRDPQSNPSRAREGRESMANRRRPLGEGTLSGRPGIFARRYSVGRLGVSVVQSADSTA